LELVLAHGTDGLKLHPLHIVRNTQLANDWRRGAVSVLTQARYVEAVAQMVLACPPGMVFHRLTATARAPTLLTPDWCAQKWPVLNAIAQRVADLRGINSGPTAAPENAAHEQAL
jgi:radical SAM superfamily enzyme